MIDKDTSYFHVMKRNKKLYRYIKFIGKGSMAKGHDLYLRAVCDAKDKMIELSHRFGEDELAMMLVNKGFQPYRDNALKFLNRLYNQNTNMQTFSRMRKILKEIR